MGGQERKVVEKSKLRNDVSSRQTTAAPQERACSVQNYFLKTELIQELLHTRAPRISEIVP